MPKLSWSPYKKLREIKFSERDFRETLDGGQSFRWYAENSPLPEYSGVFEDCHAKLRLEPDGGISVSIPATANLEISLEKVHKYLDCERDYNRLRSELASFCADPIMDSAMEFYPNLRILRQNSAEALMCFICSSSKRIVQIKQCVKLLAEKLGDAIDSEANALPSFERIAEAPLSILRECKLGFRAAYLKNTALKISADKFDANSLRKMPYPEAKKYLVSLPGIGEKVADCILLFGAARFEAFPVDTWIKQGMDSLYGTGSNPDAIRKFAKNKFGKYAGFAQQLIFAAYRNGANFSKASEI